MTTPPLTDGGDRSFSPEEIAETREIIAQTLANRSIRMEERQLDVVMRRLLLRARDSGQSPVVVAREMVRASAAASSPEDHAPGEHSE